MTTHVDTDLPAGLPESLALPGGRIITDPDTIAFCAQYEELESPAHRRIVRAVVMILSQDAETTENAQETELLRIYRDLSARNRGVLAGLARDLAEAPAEETNTPDPAANPILPEGYAPFTAEIDGTRARFESLSAGPARPQTEAEKAFVRRNRERLDALTGGEDSEDSAESEETTTLA